MIPISEAYKAIERFKGGEKPSILNYDCVENPKNPFFNLVQTPIIDCSQGYGLILEILKNSGFRTDIIQPFRKIVEYTRFINDMADASPLSRHSTDDKFLEEWSNLCLQAGMIETGERVIFEGNMISHFDSDYPYKVLRNVTLFSLERLDLIASIIAGSNGVSVDTARFIQGGLSVVSAKHFELRIKPFPQSFSLTAVAMKNK